MLCSGTRKSRPGRLHICLRLNPHDRVRATPWLRRRCDIMRNGTQCDGSHMGVAEPLLLLTKSTSHFLLRQAIPLNDSYRRLRASQWPHRNENVSQSPSVFESGHDVVPLHAHFLMPLCLRAIQRNVYRSDFERNARHSIIPRPAWPSGESVCFVQSSDDSTRGKKWSCCMKLEAASLHSLSELRKCFDSCTGTRFLQPQES